MDEKINPLSDSLWIAPSYPCASPVFTKKFLLDGIPHTAVLFITGLGYFEAKINGRLFEMYQKR